MLLREAKRILNRNNYKLINEQTEDDVLYQLVINGEDAGDTIVVKENDIYTLRSKIQGQMENYFEKNENSKIKGWTIYRIFTSGRLSLDKSVGRGNSKIDLDEWLVKLIKNNEL